MRRHNTRAALSPVAGRFGCMALQVLMNIVVKQLQRRPIVPRTWGSGTQATVAFVGDIANRYLGKQPEGLSAACV